jgi:chorismate dehydratase
VNKIRVSAVSYTNTKPFIYGLEHSGILNSIDLSLDNPSECAEKLIDDKADIGLVPVAALTSIANYEIISDYCIGADGAVDSVFIFSNKPVEKIRTLRLDPQSRTSNALAGMLLKEYWKTDVQFIQSGDADAYVEIGDRTFGKKNQVGFVYDLALAWKEFTGLPFVFAVWVTNKKIDEDFIDKFNTALKYGLDHRADLLRVSCQNSEIDLEDYLMNKINYFLTAEKREAISKFLNLV